LFFALAAGPAFRSWAGLATVLNAAAPLGILAAAVALLMIAGEFDLSVGATIGASGMLMAGLIGEAGWDPTVAALAGLALAGAIGAFNGAVVVRTGLPSLIVTLAVMFAVRGATIGLARGLTGSTQLAASGSSATWEALRALLASEVAGLRVSIGWWVAITAALGWVLARSVLGNWILAAGGAPESARAAGVPVRGVKVTLFVTTSVAAWLIALIQLLRFGGSDALRGQGQEFHAIVAAVIGGALLTGGYGSVLGAAFGALIYGVARQGMVITGVDADWFQAALGALLLGAAWLNHRSRIAAARSAAHAGETEAPPAPTQFAPAVPPSAAGATTPVLEAREVSRSYGAVDALREASLRLHAGRVTCLVGDNGAGKSTLIRTLTGVEAPDQGAVLLDGRKARLRSPAHARRAGIAVVHQHLALAPLMSVWRNFVLGAEQGGAPLRPLDATACRSATRAGAAALGVSLDPVDRPLAALSGGQRQALAIARALAGSPRVLILDEPTAALGVTATDRVLDAIRAVRGAGVAVLLVTHDPAQALAVGDDIVVLARGGVVADESAERYSAARLRSLMRGIDPQDT
ncbi:MAG: ATP-binding cassette domain-containing protein, partial [Gemmatimonadota bacterium]